MRSIEFCREHLNIDIPMIFSSDIDASGSKSELISNICKEVGAKTYLSGPSGKGYLNQSFFDKLNIEVEFFEPQVNNYYSALYNIIHV